MGGSGRNWGARWGTGGHWEALRGTGGNVGVTGGHWAVLGAIGVALGRTRGHWGALGVSLDGTGGHGGALGVSLRRTGEHWGTLGVALGGGEVVVRGAGRGDPRHPQTTPHPVDYTSRAPIAHAQRLRAAPPTRRTTPPGGPRVAHAQRATSGRMRGGHPGSGAERRSGRARHLPGERGRGGGTGRGPGRGGGKGGAWRGPVGVGGRSPGAWRGPGAGAR